MHKKARLILLVLTLSLVSCDQFNVSGFFQSVSDAFDQSKGVDEQLLVYEENLVDQFDPILTDMGAATRYSIEIDITESIMDINGRLNVVYTNNENVDLNEIYFRMFPNVSNYNMIASDIRVNGEKVPLVLEHLDTAIRVDLPNTLSPGESVEISMEFAQTVPSNMGGNYGLYIFQEEILALDQFFPIIPVYDDEGWNVEDPPINADMIYTDAAFFHVTVSAPGDLILAGSGVELSSEIEGDKQIITYAGGPQRDFYLAASPRFLSESEIVGDTLVTSYFVEEFRDSGKMVLETAVHALNSYNERFGLYPYTELDLISTPMSAGGMEYSGATSLSIYYYDPTFSPIGLAFLEGATAHEVAHQWFFNQVMSDQLDEPWLDEALVQYATYLYYVDRYGEDGAQGFVQSWYQRWSRVEMEEIPIGRPAGDYDAMEYSPIIYGRGPLFFAALEDELGEQTFAELLKEYTEEYCWGISDTASFKIFAEEKCECDLTALFEEWIYD